MEKLEKYKYHYRLGHDSDKMLIEFISKVESENFGTDLFDALREIDPILIGHEDLFMNDETLYYVKTNLGQFMLSKDIWNFAFIMSEDNQACVNQINNLLFKDHRFEKIEV